MLELLAHRCAVPPLPSGYVWTCWCGVEHRGPPRQMWVFGMSRQERAAAYPPCCGTGHWP